MIDGFHYDEGHLEEDGLTSFELSDIESGRDAGAILTELSLPEGMDAKYLGPTLPAETEADAHFGELDEVAEPADILDTAEQDDDSDLFGEGDEVTDRHTGEIDEARQYVDAADEEPTPEADVDGSGTDIPTNNLPPTGGNGHDGHGDAGPVEGGDDDNPDDEGSSKTGKSEAELNKGDRPSSADTSARIESEEDLAAHGTTIDDARTYVWVRYSEDGTATLTEQPAYDDVRETADTIEALRDEYRAETIDALRPYMLENPPAINEERVEHFLKALNLPPPDPVVVLRDANDSETAETLQRMHLTTTKYDPDSTRHAFHDIPRGLVVVDGNSWSNAASEGVERNLIHEHAHKSSVKTWSIDQQKVMTVHRNGFKYDGSVSRDTAAPGLAEGALPEESFAALTEGVYRDLFLSKPDLRSRPKPPDGAVDLPSKYILLDKDGNEGSTNGAFGATAIELLAQHDPHIMQDFFDARLSREGIERFAERVNRVASRPLFQELNQMDDVRSEHIRGFQQVMAVFPPDQVSKAVEALETDSPAKKFIVAKLRAYEERTGYNFGLPSDDS